MAGIRRPSLLLADVVLRARPHRLDRRSSPIVPDTMMNGSSHPASFNVASAPSALKVRHRPVRDDEVPSLLMKCLAHRHRRFDPFGLHGRPILRELLNDELRVGRRVFDQEDA